MAEIYHVVHFWLKPELGVAGRQAFVAGLRGLVESPNVVRVRVGRPVVQEPGRERAVVEASYDYQLFVEFADQAAAEAYQDPADQVHTEFIERFKDAWSRVLIFDSAEVA